MARIGLGAIKAAVVDDDANRVSLHERFAISQETAQIDPWAERAKGGVESQEFKPMAHLPLGMAAE